MRSSAAAGVAGLLLVAPAIQAATTINESNCYAYGANIGWINCRGDITNGAVIGEYYCSGYLWAANVGWISLGAGTPTNGWQYSNTASNDWGVNHDGLGNLRGYAYGANIGWIAFESNGNPRVDLLTGDLSGYVWGANVGWISLSNAQAFVQTDRMDPGPDTDSDNIPDPWEYENASVLTRLSGGADYDGDGVTDDDEYRADTDPTDNSSLLFVVDFERINTTNTVEWTVEPTRLYLLEQADGLMDSPSWSDSGYGIIQPSTNGTLRRSVTDTGVAVRVYRIRAVVPLSQ